MWDTQLFFLIEFAPMHGSPFKPERLLKSETRKRRDLFPRCKRFFLDPDAAQSWLFPLSVSVSRRRPRASRDMTVPIGTSVV